jgi:hypothetical protein
MLEEFKSYKKGNIFDSNESFKKYTYVTSLSIAVCRSVVEGELNLESMIDFFLLTYEPSRGYSNELVNTFKKLKQHKNNGDLKNSCYMPALNSFENCCGISAGKLRNKRLRIVQVRINF